MKRPASEMTRRAARSRQIYIRLKKTGQLSEMTPETQKALGALVKAASRAFLDARAAADSEQRIKGART